MELIATGTYGKIYKRKEKGFGEVAVKTMGKSTDCRYELEIAQRFSGRANFIQILGVEETEETLSMTMPYIKNTLLDLVVSRTQKEGGNKPLSLTRLYTIFSQMVDAVETMHKEGFVHKDLKLENILYRHGSIYLCDFGYSRPYVKGVKSLQDRLGSLHYSAPELWHSRPYEGPECDVWALGICLYLLATGYFPFCGQSPKEVFESIENSPGLYFPPTFASRRLQNLIKRMLTYDADSRITIAEIQAHPFMIAGRRACAEAPKYPSDNPPLLTCSSKPIHNSCQLDSTTAAPPDDALQPNLLLRSATEGKEFLDQPQSLQYASADPEPCDDETATSSEASSSSSSSASSSSSKPKKSRFARICSIILGTDN